MKPFQARCEVCFRVFQTTDKKAATCPFHTKAVVKLHEPDEPEPIVLHTERCEACFTVHRSSLMSDVKNQRLCAKCAEPKMQWYALSVRENDTKVKKYIRDKLRKDNLLHKLGRIIIPKEKSARLTKNSYDVFSAEDAIMGRVSAHDATEALQLAREQFTKKQSKGVFHPEVPKPDEILLDRIEKTKENRRIVYLAYSKTNKLLGKIIDPKESRAKETAERLYGDHTKIDRFNPNKGTVKEVRLVKEGGKIKVQNKRAVPGYLLVECYQDPYVFTAIKTSRGVNTMLPFTKPMTWEDIEEEGPPIPHTIEAHELESVVEKPVPKEMHTDYKPGEKVTLVGNTYNGTEAIVREVKPDNKFTVELKIMNMPVKILAPHTSLRRM